MAMTFTYDHPKYNQSVQHEVTELVGYKVDGNSAVIKFKDDKRRLITVCTNSHYVLREEVDLDAMPEVEVQE